MDLRKRLANLDRLTRKPQTPPPVPLDLEAVRRDLDLEEEILGPGTLWCRRGSALLPPPRPLPALHGFFARDPGPALDPESLLFVDTETTGLAGGTGTLPFMVGLAWWEGDRLQVEQLLLPGPQHEAALLAGVARRAEGRQAVVTYNGASFDLPLIRTRALLNRCDDPLAGPRVWDLVVPSRRLWSRRLPDCRQQTVEESLGRTARGEDEVPGPEIPAVWFTYLAGDGHARLDGVLRHNQRDMEGMARILLAVARAAENLADGPSAEPPTSWHDAWARGRICEQRGDTPGAASWLRHALEHTDEPGRPALVVDALRLLKRDADHAGAAAVADGAVAAGLGESWLHREIAILWEHRLADLDKALAHALLAGDDHRVARLRRRGAGGPGKDPS